MYRFESWIPGSTTIITEGSSASTNDGVLTNSAINGIVISSDYAVGTHSLLVRNRGSTGAYSYLSISGNLYYIVGNRGSTGAYIAINLYYIIWGSCLSIPGKVM